MAANPGGCAASTSRSATTRSSSSSSTAAPEAQPPPFASFRFLQRLASAETASRLTGTYVFRPRLSLPAVGLSDTCYRW